MADERIQQILDELRDFKYEFIEFKTKIETEYNTYSEKMRTIEKVIFGNGNKGVKQQITELETKIAVFAGIGSVIGSAIITSIWKMLIR